MIIPWSTNCRGALPQSRLVQPCLACLQAWFVLCFLQASAHEEGLTEVATGNHDAVRGSDNVRYVGDGVIALHLGHDLDDLGGPGPQVALQVVDDIGCLHKGYSDEVDLLADGEVNVQPVLQDAHSLLSDCSPEEGLARVCHKAK